MSKKKEKEEPGQCMAEYNAEVCRALGRQKRRLKLPCAIRMTKNGVLKLRHPMGMTDLMVGAVSFYGCRRAMAQQRKRMTEAWRRKMGAMEEREAVVARWHNELLSRVKGRMSPNLLRSTT